MENVITSIDHAVEAFLLSCQVKGCANLTLRTYQEALARLRRRIGGDVGAMTRLAIQSHLADLQASGLKQVTVHKHYRAIRRFLAWCVEGQVLPNHPLQGFQMKRPHTFPRVPTDSEVKLILRTCDDTPQGKRRRALILFFSDTGLRVTEALRLHIEDVNVGLRSCTIREGKGQKARTVFFGATTAKALRDYLATRGNVYAEDFLLARADGRPMTRFQAGHILAGLSKEVGLGRRIHPHALRHYFATAFLRAGGDMESLRQLLGHSTLTMTLRYCHMLQLDVAKNYRRASPVDHMLCL